MGFQHKESYRQCSAKSKRSGVQCRNYAMHNGVCRMHGGKSIRGTDNASYYHGYHSKDAYAQLVWDIIKRTWRDGVQRMRLVLAMEHAPETLNTQLWNTHKIHCLREIRKPIPDIPKDHYITLWQAWKQGQSQGVQDAVRDILLGIYKSYLIA